MYVNRETVTGLAPESPSDHEQQRRPSFRPGQGSRVAVEARPTASREWRREPKHGRRRPAASVTTLKQQRPVQQEKTVTRHDHSQRRYVSNVRLATPPSHSTPLISTATPVDGSTITRLSTNSGRHSRLSGNSHGRQFVSSSGSATRPSHSIGLNTPTTSTSTTVATVVRHRNSSATRAQFQSHCVSVHINCLTELL